MNSVHTFKKYVHSLNTKSINSNKLCEKQYTSQEDCATARREELYLF